MKTYTIHISPNDLYQVNTGIAFEVENIEEIKYILEKQDKIILHPIEFESLINQGFELLTNPAWKNDYFVRSYEYMLVGNKGNPTLFIELTSNCKLHASLTR